MIDLDQLREIRDLEIYRLFRPADGSKGIKQKVIADLYKLSTSRVKAIIATVKVKENDHAR